MITLLDQNTINKIAAGEVIERPSAVVKELVENAIDAGSNAITVEIKEGGISFIRITDNGAGISPDEIELAFKRHSTSKIKSVEDLMTIKSLGFRGEALASIAAVSQVELVTKTQGALTGSRFLIEGGETKSLEEIGCPEGTTFLVRNLFFNTPARRKFLKSAMTEASYVGDLIERIAISHPDVAFKFINNNQVKLQTSGNNNIKDIIYHVYGRDIASVVVPVEKSDDSLTVSGFIGKPVVSRGNRNYMNYFINGRYIKSSVINRAIEEAYKPYTMTHRYPFTVLTFDMDSTMIDVNVHPTKMEVRISNQEEVFRMTYDAISEALRQKELIPEVTLDDPKEKKNSSSLETRKIQSATTQVNKNTEEPYMTHKQTARIVIPKSSESVFLNKNGNNVNYMEGMKPQTPGMNGGPEVQCKEAPNEVPQEPVKPVVEKGPEPFEVHRMEADNKAHSEQLASNVHPEDLREDSVYQTGTQMNLFGKEDKEQPAFLSEEHRKEHRIIGQLFSTYWLIEFHDKLFIIDQHAAHEKVLFERTMASIKNREFASQILNPPIILTLSMSEEEVLKRNQEVFEQLGFEIEPFGGKEYSVRAVPANLCNIAQKELLIEMIDDLVTWDGRSNSELLLEKVASLSCKAAVKGNMHLSTNEAYELIDELMTLDNPYNCPHGRPTIISMTKYEIEKKFKRIV